MNFNDLNSSVKKLSINLTSTQIFQLKTYMSLLKEWNKVMNLTAINEDEEIIEKHFYDSLLGQLVIPFTTQKVIDVGSGAGFPGLVLKIAFPNLDVTLLEPTTKRCNFLNEVINKLNLQQVNVINARAEEYVLKNREKYDIVVSRGVSRLNILLELCIPFLKVNGMMLAYKGKRIEEELFEASNALNTLHSEITSKVICSLPSEQENRALVLIRKLKSTEQKYPRNYGVIKKRPL